ncbi:MAG: esterase-like activity of phytase family protein [Cyanobium sp. M30B3]|nr:MAG: esterase-like activity of phytase family protein [Cyanobium sp. M30B3]
MALAFNLLAPAITAQDGVIDVSALGANAEISAYNPITGYLYTVGGGSGAIVVSDLSDPANPKAVAVATPLDNSETLQSAAVFGKLLAVAVEETDSSGPGFVQFYDLSNPALPVHLSTVSVGPLPDMVKFNGDGSKLLVTNEGEPNALYTIDPEGSISVINTSGYLAATPVAPVQADVQTIGFGAWENRRAELINRGIRIGQRLGVTTTVAQDIEPEAIAISADGSTAWISLQENNAFAVLDLSGAEPVVKEIFSAGIKDWSRGVASAQNFNFELEYAAGAANQPADVQAGGLSGLTFAGTETVNGTELDIYYSITDRGPNGDLIDGKREFLDPDFQPSIYKLGMNRATGAISELGRIGLNRPDGTPLTGLPQLAGKDDVPIDGDSNLLAYDPFGIDSETVSLFTLTIGGSERPVFAVGDEYRGQIAIFDAASGNLIQRYIPAGQKAQLAAQHNVDGATPIGAETIDSLPAVYGNRWSNRGIEGMAFNPTDGLLYAFMQSPLDVDANGDGVTEGRSLSELTRILAIDPATGAPVKEHLYLLSGRAGQDKIGDVAFDPDRGVFLVIERDSSRSLTGFKHVFEVDLRGATNTLPLTTAANQATDGWLAAIGLASPELLDNRRILIDHDGDPATPDIFSTSSADALAAAGIRLAHKIELFNLPSIGGSLAYDKPEGLTIRDDGALVINYDNDFGTEGASGNTFTVVSFDGAGFDSSDRDVDGSSGGGNRYLPVSGLPLYGLTMPDGIATYTDAQGRQFLLAAGEGDSRAYPGEDLTVNGVLFEEESVLYDLTRANSGDLVNGVPFRDHPGVAALNAAFAAATGVSRTRLNLLNETGDIDGDGLIDKPFSIGSRSLRIYDAKGNVVFDSSDQLEELANSLGLMAGNRDDDKGTEPEMVEIATVAGRTYAFVALERTTTSVAAVFDITDPYNVAAVDPVVFPGSNRIEGITFLRSAAGEPAGLIASSEGNDVVSITSAAPLAQGSAFKLQLFHLADQEGNISALDDAPRLSGVLNALRAQDIDLDGIPGFANTLTLSSGDAWIPGLFYGASAPAYGYRDQNGNLLGFGRGDVLIQNALGVQAIAFGNHEFDQGPEVIKDLIGGSEDFPGTAFPYLSSNLDFSTDVNLAGLVVPGGQAPEANSITSSVVFDVNGEQVGVVGATTPWLKTISSPGDVGIAPAPFSGTPTPAELDALAAEIQSDVDALIAANPGLNKVILLAHMQQLSIEQALAERLRHVDIIVAGGSNSRLFDADDSARPGDSTQGVYPIITSDADGKPVAVVNTDGTYKYLGRLVLDFDAAGTIIPESYDPTISGAYRTDAAGLEALNAEDFIDARVQEVADTLREVIVAQESEWFGVSDVFLNGNRNPGVRSEETNLGNLTADANLAYARQVDPTVMVSLKNGGGIRNSIGQSLIPTGSVDGVPELLPTAAVFDAQGNVVKPEGGISRNDIANALSFNNGLSLVSVTPAELKALIEFGVAAGAGGGRFPQVGGMAFSYDLSRPAGERVLNLTIEDQAGNDLDVVVRDGAVVGDPARSIRMVTLNFLAGGGDGYPFTSLTNPNRLDLTASDSAPRTGVATFAADGSEQDALAEFLAANHSPENPYAEADTAQALDTRLQNLAVRSDAVIDPVRVGTSGDDTTLPGASTIPGFDGRLDTVFTGAGNDEIDIALTGGGDNTIFTGSGANTVYAGTRDVITGGADSDQIWAIAGDGNRLSGMGGNDDFVIGSSGNRALGGDGNDVFTILDGAGTNYLNGGAGSDQFWLVSGPGDLPAAKQFVMDFKAGEDLVGLRGASFSDLSFSQVGADTLLNVSGTSIGHFTGVSAAALNNQANFVFA